MKLFHIYDGVRYQLSRTVVSNVSTPVDGVIIDIFASTHLFGNKKILPVATLSQGIHRLVFAKKQVLRFGQGVMNLCIHHRLKQFFLQIPGLFVTNAAKILKAYFFVVHT